MSTERVWHTLGHPQQRLIVKGTSAVDPDCLVAYLAEDPSPKPLWIVKSSGYVCGLPEKTYARRGDISFIDPCDCQ